MSASRARTVCRITGARASQGPYRPHRFHVARRTRVVTSGPYPGSNSYKKRYRTGVIKRVLKNLTVLSGPAPQESEQLERDGWALVRDVFSAEDVAQLRKEIDDTFEMYPPERGRDDREEFRYEMLNRSAACQAVVAHSSILAVIEPLLGED